MGISTLILLAAFLLPANGDFNSDKGEGNNAEGRENLFFVYDQSTDSFNRIPKTEASVDSLLDLGNENRDKDSSLSFRSARQALTIAEQINYKPGLARAYNLIGSKYLDFGDHEMAHTSYLKSMRIEEEFGNSEGIASLLNNISLIYVEQEQYDLAANYLKASIDAWKEISKEHESLIGTNNLGVIYRRSGEYEKALDLFWDTSRWALEKDDPDSLAYYVATLNIGNTYRNMGDLVRAKIHLHTALDYLEREGLASHIIFTKIVLGELYKDLQQTDTALMYARNALQLATEQQMRQMVKNAHELLAEIHESDQNFALANQHLRLQYAHDDTLQNMQRGDNIEKLQSRFEVEQKERTIEMLNKEAELREANLTRMNQFRSFLIASVLLLFVIIGLLYREYLAKKRNNDQLEHKQKEIEEKNRRLQKLNEEKDEFMSIAAHDLRNPLSSVKMAVDLINSNESFSRSSLTEYTDLIRISADRMIALINNVLQIHTIDSSATSESAKKVYVNDLINESLHHFNKPAKSKNIRLSTVLDSNLSPIAGDSDNLLRIFDNLISNAVKYSPKNSAVIISTRQTEDVVQITIRDQGPGIKTEEMNKLFGKFSRLSNKPTADESSTGLGLYIVKKICTSMGGDVRCESEPGCGAAFIVDLPVEKLKSKKVPSKSVQKKKKIAG